MLDDILRTAMLAFLGVIFRLMTVRILYHRWEDDRQKPVTSIAVWFAAWVQISARIREIMIADIYSSGTINQRRVAFWSKDPDRSDLQVHEETL